MSEPALFVFDLDFTLWDCGGTWCDHLTPPFSSREGGVFDRHAREIVLYPEAREIIAELSEAGHVLGLASRTGEPDWARELLERLDLLDQFQYQEIYPGSKVTHFRRLAADSGRAFSEMVFFDDEQRNITEVGALGVHAVLVRSGINRQLIDAVKRV